MSNHSAMNSEPQSQAHHFESVERAWKRSIADVRSSGSWVESVRDGLGITVSYWRSLEDIANWKRVADHLEAQRSGREKWYATYKTRIAKVERDYGFGR